MGNLNEKIIDILTEEFSLKKWQIENTIELIDAGNTIPFIARYRKEKTGSLDDEILRTLSDRLSALRSLEDRKSEVTRLIDEQGKLTDELIHDISEAKTVSELEDIYRPYRPKRRTRAIIARERGLEPLAKLILKQDIFNGSMTEYAQKYIDKEKGVENEQDALNGAMDIIAEEISDNANFRKHIKEVTRREANIVTKAAKDEDSVYRLYYDFSEPLKKLAHHRLLAVNRGEKEGFLR